MKTPKKIRRHTLEPSKLAERPSEGNYTHSLDNPVMGLLVAQVASAFVHLESSMATVLAVLLGHENSEIAGYILRAIKSPKGRVDVMKDLLELAPVNKDLPGSFDPLVAKLLS